MCCSALAQQLPILCRLISRVRELPPFGKRQTRKKATGVYHRPCGRDYIVCRDLNRAAWPTVDACLPFGRGVRGGHLSRHEPHYACGPCRVKGCEDRYVTGPVIGPGARVKPPSNTIPSVSLICHVVPGVTTVSSTSISNSVALGDAIVLPVWVAGFPPNAVNESTSHEDRSSIAVSKVIRYVVPDKYWTDSTCTYALGKGASDASHPRSRR